MAKLTLTNTTSGFLSADAINNNNTAIENAVENTLSRDGTGPNQMGADLDMNGYNILNQANPINVTGLSAGTAYTFSVTATNGIGNSNASLASGNITTADVPGAPTSVSGTATSAGTIQVSFTAPASTGGLAITGDLSVSGNATLSGNILGDRDHIGLHSRQLIENTRQPYPRLLQLGVVRHVELGVRVAQVQRFLHGGLVQPPSLDPDLALVVQRHLDVAGIAQRIEHGQQRCFLFVVNIL